MPANPPQNLASPFASFAGHHVGVRVPDYDAAVAWYTEKLDFRVLQEWPYGDLRLAYLSPAADDDFHLELLAGPIEHPRPVLDDLGQSLTYGGYQHFCLRVASVDKARAELAARGVDVLGELEPGIALIATPGRPTVPMATKAGGFGDEETWPRCIAQVLARGPAGPGDPARSAGPRHTELDLSLRDLTT